MNTVKFVSYDGKYPNLCTGILILSINEKEYVFPKGSLIPPKKGQWKIYKFPKGFPPKFYSEAKKLVNENIPYGCCGGCS